MSARTISLLIAGSLSFSLASAISSLAADGSLKIKFTLDGQAPKPKAVPGAGFCGPKMLVDESLVIGPKNEIQNIGMWLWTTKDTKAPDSPAAIKALPREVKLEITGCRYEPHIVFMHTSQTLVISNTDPIGHNTRGDLFNQPFNVLIPAGGAEKLQFTKTENWPRPLACSIHPWMHGYILIRDNPFFGVSDAKGVLTIPHVPEGEHTFVLWHESRGFVRSGIQGGKKVEWKHGKMEVTIAGDTDLGELAIPLDVLVK